MRTLVGLSIAVLLAATAAPQARAQQPFTPNDPGTAGVPGGWMQDQWNFLPGVGVDAPRAWTNLIAAGRPGGVGVKVAVLDTGLAYENRGPFKKDPDLSRARIAPGKDFCPHAGGFGNPCAGVDNTPDDPDGHGTHVASTIAEATANGVGVTGLAYGVTIIPVKVLDRDGYGSEESIAKGIDYAVARGAQVINLSFEFGGLITAPNQIPKIVKAAANARRHNVLIVAAAGNGSMTRVAYPARLPQMMAVGAVTERDCLATYSDTGPGLDLVAPGGGIDAVRSDPGCDPSVPGRPIVQMTYTYGSHTKFVLSKRYYGTSMAAPHVAAAAALVIASGVLGPHPTVVAIEKRLESTARDLGPPGPDHFYGAGLLDAGAATAPNPGA